MTQPERYAIDALPDGQPPFFITGSGRCGTTLIRRILVNNPDLVIPPENYSLRRSHVRWRDLSHHGWKTFTSEVVEDLASQDNWESFGLDAVKLVLTLHEAPTELQGPEGFWNIFHAAYGQAHSRVPKRWGDKTPLAADRLGPMSVWFPGAKVIRPVRDAYDVVASWGRVPGWEGRHIDAAERWVNANEAADAFSLDAPGQVLTVSYEDLVREPGRYAREIFEFLDIPFELDYLENRSDSGQLADADGAAHHTKIAAPIDQSSVGRGFERIPEDLRAEVTDIVGDLQARYGYSLR